uniref:Uncharacterized protein n=1 Tax=Oryza sativa subsp. japonica TaxID=39947 RepID=Q6H608_ORYSJ|nr:hypothetical protein [Oryza sativa Japonica Group]
MRGSGSRPPPAGADGARSRGFGAESTAAALVARSRNLNLQYSADGLTPTPPTFALSIDNEDNATDHKL